ncbi:DUF3138 family protein [Methylocaldum marinum]|uniref:DUF3138 family protein n=1 Tax=Methylocaldum marinum TaxID=1432792 RepID=UPI000E688BD2|nr:DUF3138 family protein [Methylocaldum marinum]
MTYPQLANSGGRQFFRRSARYAGVVLAAGLVPGTAAAVTNAAEITDLKKQIEQLQKTMEALQARVEQAESAAAAAAPVEGEVPATQEDIQGLTTDLENFKWQWQRERETHTALSTRALTIGGTVQGRYGWNEAKFSGGDVVRRDNSFDIGAALISFSGNLYRDYEEGRNLLYRVSFGASPQTGVASANLLDAQVSYDVLPTINLEESRLRLTLGQQLLPFGLEVNATEDLKPLIQNALFTGASIPLTTKDGRSVSIPGTGLAARQIGFIARGDLFPQVDWGSNYRAPIVEYAIGVVNGNGANRSDDNSAKDFIGHLGFTAPVDYNSWLREIKIGGSFYFGTQNVRETYYTDASRTATATTLLDEGEKNRVGLDFSYNHNPIGLTFEWVRSWDEVYPGISPFKTKSPEHYIRKGEAFTTTLFYNFGAQFVKSYRSQGRYDDWWPKSYQVFFRWDSWDPDIRNANDKIQYLTPGINIFFAETTKLQLNYYHQILEDSNIERNDQFLAQIQFGF